MQTVRTLAGYSMGRADVIRKAMGKKKVAILEKEREIFLHGLKDDNGNYIVDGCEKMCIRDSNYALRNGACVANFAIRKYRQRRG